MKKKLCLIVGSSGVGKSTVVKWLCDFYKLREVASYTTRPKRNYKDTDHIYITTTTFDKIKENLIAYTKIGEYEYGATLQAIEMNDIYIIDENGIKELIKNYTGDKELYVVRLVGDEATYIQRMRLRGDSEKSIKERLFIDKKREKELKEIAKDNKITGYYEFIVGNRSVEDIGTHIYSAVWSVKGE